jgi:hypothetical protein
MVERDRGIGAVAHSWATVWIVGPPDLTRRRRQLVAAAGPAAGVSWCVALLSVAPAWICVSFAAVHLVSLLPLAPDGRLVFDR